MRSEKEIDKEITRLLNLKREAVDRKNQQWRDTLERKIQVLKWVLED